VLIIVLLKGVPARTTKVVTVSGVLRREQMELVMNPHDARAIEAAHYVKRQVGGKIVGLSMGPEPKLVPIMKDLFEPEQESRLVPRMPVFGLDECVLLSDRRMAGADTWATSYALAKGVHKLIQIHNDALDELIRMARSGSSSRELEVRAKELYDLNMLPNGIYSTLPTVKDSLVRKFVKGRISVDELVQHLSRSKAELLRFIILAGMKTSDGETGNVGPQTAEALGESLGSTIPSIAFVREFQVFPEEWVVVATRRLGSLQQKLRTPLPCLLTLHVEYEPTVPEALRQKRVRSNNYKGKVTKVQVWNADIIGAEPSKLGLAGSPTIVGPGMEIGKPPVQKTVGETLVFTRDISRLEWNAQTYGPFKQGDVVPDLPEELRAELLRNGDAEKFTLRSLAKELFGGQSVVARAA